MAWYRAGGGGIPSSLKTDMNDVLNKKFGTSTTYPAEDWPDTVNLMGPLPEKTVSSSPIVTFADGADAVPLKKCEITLPASLDGYSEVDVISAGKNLLDLSNITNGDYSGTGAEFVNNVVAVSPMAIKGGANYIMTCSSSVSGFYISFYDENNTEITEGRVSAYNVTSKTFSTPANAVTYIPMWYNASGLTPADVVSKSYMIEAGSTATTYEPYTAPTTNTASLGRTIYGGTADVVAGQGEISYIKYVIDGVNNYGFLTSSNNMNIMPYGLLNVDTNTNHWICNISTNFGYNAYNGFIFLRQAGWSSLPDVTDAPSFNAYCQANPIVFIIPLATPETFTFDPVPIDSKLGNNTIWSEQGDTEVTYRADINLALGGQ